MFKFFFALALLITFPVFAQSTCQRLNQEINNLHEQVNGIELPEISFTITEENCALALPTMQAAYDIETYQMKLLSNYEKYYFECGQDVELIYVMEDLKINIVLMQTLTALAKDLDGKCRNAF